MALPNLQVLYRTPMVDPQTGLVSREWLRYFAELSAALAELNSGLDATLTLSSITTLTVVDGLITSAV
jgi:hypothetical protein